MKISQKRWYVVTGKAGFGKTFWIRAHLRKIVKTGIKVFILDFNGDDYTEFKTCKNVEWVQTRIAREVDDFIWQAYTNGNCVVVFGDSDSYIRRREMSEQKEMFFNTGRNRNICAIFDTKRVFNLPPDVRNRINVGVFFKKTETKDIQALEEWAGEDEGFFRELRTLGVGEHVIYDFDNSELMPIQAPVLA
jgi:hypothetical protein